MQSIKLNLQLFSVLLRLSQASSTLRQRKVSLQFFAVDKPEDVIEVIDNDETLDGEGEEKEIAEKEGGAEQNAHRRIAPVPIEERPADWYASSFRTLS